MKRIKKGTVRAMLGLTQEQIAGLLKVSRSLWSHYEGLRRNLPQGAGTRIGEMITYMLTPEAKALKSLSKPEYLDNRTTLIIEKRLVENDYQLQVIVRKIASEQEKFENYSKAVQLMDFLNSPEEVKKARSLPALNAITVDVIDNYLESKSKLRLLLIDQNSCKRKK
ncbi:MAG: helix-turn-helix domain-containing protein [Flavobacterium sp. JAD_PAG50586_2]|nr:MAG: helix-turn-helix domain-containing protein [Flavobacterium sp. JAD_PAG50586_2]